MKKWSKTLLSLGLAAMMAVSGSGTVYAAAASGEAGSNPTRTIMGTTYTDFTASVDSITVDVYSYSVDLSWYGTGRSFNVYLNGTLATTKSGSYDCDHNYNYDTYESEDTYTYYRDSYYTYLSNLQIGKNNTIKIVPTDKDNNEVASAAKSVSVKIEMPKVNYIYSSISSQLYGDEKSGYSGYGTYYTYLSWDMDKSGSTKYEVYRSTSTKSSSFKKIAETTSTYYNDESIEMGKTYYYKILPYAGTVKGDFSAVQKVEATISSSYSYIVLNDKNKPVVIAYASTRFSGFNIYRSTKQASGYKKIATITEERYTDTTAKEGSTYYYKTQPYYYNPKTKKTIAGEMSEPLGVKIVLGAGLNLETKQTAKNQVKLSWKKASGATAYDVYVKTGSVGDAYKYLGTTKGTSYTAKKLSTTDYYTFVVQAYKQDSKKIKTYYKSESGGVTMGIHSPNVTVASRTFSSNSAKDQITINNKLTWNKVFGIAGYLIEKYDSSKGDYVQVKKLKASATSYTYKQIVKSGATNATNIRVTAYKGSKTYGSTVSLDACIGNVTSIKIKESGTNGTTISWKAAKGADQYNVYRYTPMGMSVTVGNTAKTTITDKGLTPGVSYRYVIRAYNSKLYLNDDSDYYYEGETYGDKVTYPGQAYFTLKNTAPTLSKVTNASGKKAKLTWKKVSEATSFVIYRSTKKNSGFTKVGTAKKGATSFTDSKLKKGTTYYYKVAWCTTNDAGASAESALSAAKSVKIKK